MALQTSWFRRKKNQIQCMKNIKKIYKCNLDHNLANNAEKKSEKMSKIGRKFSPNNCVVMFIALDSKATKYAHS